MIVQHNMCWAVRNLAINDANRQALLAQGAAPLVVAAMDQHPEQPSLHHRACWACVTLATTEDGQILLAEEGAIRAVIRALHRHVQEPQQP